MMVSTKGRYALRVMIDLAQNQGEGYVSLKEIAARQEISMKYLEMIVSILNKSGFLLSRRGKEGGYILAKEPDAYTVGSVLKLTEGSLAPVSCIDGDKGCTCARADMCLTLPMWRKLDSIVDGYLEQITIQDLIDGKI